MPIIFAALTFISTFCGGLLALKYRDKLHIILGFTAGVLLGVVSFDIFPEIVALVNETKIDVIIPMIALVLGFLLFHILEKTILIHHAHEEEYGQHHHPQVGMLSALALAGHSFLDGFGIGMGFQISSALGIIIAIAVISHDFCDGLNTVSLMLVHKNSRNKSLVLLTIDAVAPVIGVLLAAYLSFSSLIVLMYLGFFAGFLLYIGASDILPEAHSQHSSWRTIIATLLGVLFIFVITRVG